MRRMILLAAITAAMFGGTAGSARALLGFTASTTGCTTTVLGILSVGCMQTSLPTEARQVTTTYAATLVISGQPTALSCTESDVSSFLSRGSFENYTFGCKTVLTGQPLLSGSCTHNWANSFGHVTGSEQCTVATSTASCTVHLADQNGQQADLNMILGSLGPLVVSVVGIQTPIFLPSSTPTTTC